MPSERRGGDAAVYAAPVALAVSLKGITKRFPGVVANDNITFDVEEGTIHALVGENGAGKSTLMKILYGMQQADEGTMTVNGTPVHFRSPTDAIAAGIGMVHQHFQLASNFTVLENIILGMEPGRGTIDFDGAREKLVKLEEAYGLDVDPDAYVSELAVGEKQRIEILKVLYRGARILILDEPTAVLVPQEVTELFENLRHLKAEGVTIIFINHKLDEVLALADRITVIRRGRTIDTVDPNDVTTKDLAELMVGSELPTPSIEARDIPDERVLEVVGLGLKATEGRDRLTDVSFYVRRGEIVGIAGVEGNGQLELLETIIGMRTQTSGTVTLNGENIDGWTTAERLDKGMGYIPEDRHTHGLLLPAPLWENAMLGHQRTPPYGNGFLINPKGAREKTQEIVDKYDVRTVGVEVAALALSGGNQQKLLFGREMEAKPDLLIAAQPTRGIDVGAQAAIWGQLREARSAGMGVLLASADFEELLGLSDRLYVIFEGRLVAELDPKAVTPEVLGKHMTGAEV